MFKGCLLVAAILLSGTALGQQLTVTASCSPAYYGIPYTCQLVATGGSPPYIWRITQGTLPLGLTLDSKSGLISGIPKQSPPEPPSGLTSTAQ
jgi:hypothetical protein